MYKLHRRRYVTQSSEAVWKSRWPSWAPRPNEPCGFCGRKATLNYLRAQELCESRGGRPGLPVLMSLMVPVDVKQRWTMLRHWSQFVPNTSARHPRTLSCTSNQLRYCDFTHTTIGEGWGDLSLFWSRFYLLNTYCFECPITTELFQKNGYDLNAYNNIRDILYNTDFITNIVKSMVHSPVGKLV